uniref:HTH psq-type domain-containing protein n=1 Tax=Cacopsylla melanoneura TaxID=428564 RepID=A0A8D8WVR1_9HEMI
MTNTFPMCFLIPVSIDCKHCNKSLNMIDLLSHYQVCKAKEEIKQDSDDDIDFTAMEPEVSLEHDVAPVRSENMFLPLEGINKHEALDKALKFVLDRGYSYRVAASMFGVSSSTLRRHFVLKYGEQRHVKYMHNRSVLNLDQERQLVAEIKQLEHLVPITKEFIASYTYKFCEKNQISHCFSREKQVAGKDWILHFLQRNTDVRLLVSKTKP